MLHTPENFNFKLVFLLTCTKYAFRILAGYLSPLVHLLKILERFLFFTCSLGILKRYLFSLVHLLVILKRRLFYFAHLLGILNCYLFVFFYLARL